MGGQEASDRGPGQKVGMGEGNKCIGKYGRMHFRYRAYAVADKVGPLGSKCYALNRHRICGRTEVIKISIVLACQLATVTGFQIATLWS